jgi:hypothetical protein
MSKNIYQITKHHKPKDNNFQENIVSRFSTG